MYSESDSSTFMGNRIVMTRVSIDFSQTEEWLEYLQGWQFVFDSQNQVIPPADARTEESNARGLCDFNQPTCDGWIGATTNSSPFQAYQQALAYAAELNALYDCTIVVENPFPCGDAQVDLPDFNPGFLSIRSNNTVVSLHTPQTPQLPDLEAAFNGEFNVPDPATNATGVYDFLVPVQVSGPGYLTEPEGFVVVDASCLGALHH